MVSATISSIQCYAKQKQIIAAIAESSKNGTKKIACHKAFKLPGFEYELLKTLNFLIESKFYAFLRVFTTKIDNDIVRF